MGEQCNFVSAQLSNFTLRTRLPVLVRRSIYLGTDGCANVIQERAFADGRAKARNTYHFQPRRAAHIPKRAVAFPVLEMWTGADKSLRQLEPQTAASHKTRLNAKIHTSLYHRFIAPQGISASLSKVPSRSSSVIPTPPSKYICTYADAASVFARD